MNPKFCYILQIGGDEDDHDLTIHFSEIIMCIICFAYAVLIEKQGMSRFQKLKFIKNLTTFEECKVESGTLKAVLFPLIIHLSQNT